MKGEILHWNRLGDARFGVKARASLMCVGFWNPFRMTGSGGTPVSPEFYAVQPKQKPDARPLGGAVVAGGGIAQGLGQIRINKPHGSYPEKCSGDRA